MWDSVIDRPTWAEINLENIGHNVREIRKRIGHGPEIMAVVKADGYGHGAERVATSALKNGATWLGVALVEEGLALRKSGIIAPILVLGSIFPAQAKRILRYGLSATVYSYEIGEALSVVATQEGKKAKVHVKIDTGMGRLGVLAYESVGFIQRILRLPNLEIEGIFTHFAKAGGDDETYTAAQTERFRQVIANLDAAGIRIPLKHAANSAALVTMAETHFDLVRPGIAVYGLSPFTNRDRLKAQDTEFELKPALSLKTRVAFVKRVSAGTSISYGGTYVTPRETTIVTLPIGYADGLHRAISGKAHVLVRGRRFPMVGTVCMDQCMVDAADEDIEEGEEVVLIGRQGTESITAEELAKEAGTINYEIVCALNKRVPRVYIKA